MTRTGDQFPVASPLLWRWFAWYAARFLRKHVHAVRSLGDPAAALRSVPADEPVIVCCNHPSWWDPMVGIYLAQRLWPGRRHLWPIDADMLRRYRFFGRLGFFGVERDDRRGAASFLRTASAGLADGNACLWVTAEGEFADVRARPLRVKDGVARLAARLGRGTILPIAVEYPFWTERTPECLLRIGTPIRAAERPTTESIAAALTAAMDELAAAAQARDPAAFTTLLGGAAGTSGVYDAWRRARAVLAGRRFDPAHVPEPEAERA